MPARVAARRHMPGSGHKAIDGNPIPASSVSSGEWKIVQNRHVSRSVPGGSCRCVWCPGGHDGLRRQAARGHPSARRSIHRGRGGAAACGRARSRARRARRRAGGGPDPWRQRKHGRHAAGARREAGGVPSRDPDRSTGPWLELAAGGRHLCVAGAPGGARRAGARSPRCQARDPGGPFLGRRLRDRLRAVLPRAYRRPRAAVRRHPSLGRRSRLVQQPGVAARLRAGVPAHPGLSVGLRDGRRRLAQRVRAAGGAGGLYPPRRHPAGAPAKNLLCQCARPRAAEGFHHRPGAAL